MKTVTDSIMSREIARFAAIGKMYGCITTGSCRPYSEVVSGYLNRF